MPFTTRPLPRVPAAADRTRKVRAWLVYLAILAFLALCVFWLRGILLPFIIALLVAYIFEPAVTRMNGVGLPRWIGVLVVYAALIGAIVLFLNYLVPIIEVESKKFGEKFGTVIQRAPSLYERLEGGVGEFFNSLGAKPEEAAPAPSSPVASEDRWVFGPPVEKIPTLPPPSLPVLPEIAFDSSEKELADSGIPAIPKATAVRLEGGTATLEQPQQPRSNLTIEQVKPGVWGVSLQNSTIEIRKTGDSTFTIAAHEEG